MAALFWSFIADETTDRQKRKLLTIVLRYVYKKKKEKWYAKKIPVLWLIY